MRLEAVGKRTRMTMVSTFDSAAALEDVLAMGMEEGIKQALFQIDAILAGSTVG